MKAQWIDLQADDYKARNWLFENLTVCGHNRTLSRLLKKCLPPSSSIKAIVPDWLDIASLRSYSQGMLPPVGSPPYYDDGDSPRDYLIAFVKQYLRTGGKKAVAVCENFGALRKQPETWSWGTPPPMVFYGEEEIYHILNASLSVDVLDSAISDSLLHWGTGVCSECNRLPEGTLGDNRFLKEIALHTRHIFIPAFDSNGYLIWECPKVSKTGGS